MTATGIGAGLGVMHALGVTLPACLPVRTVKPWPVCAAMTAAGLRLPPAPRLWVIRPLGRARRLHPLVPHRHIRRALAGTEMVGRSDTPPSPPLSPEGDHVPRTRAVRSCVLPSRPVPAPPRRNALRCIRERDGRSVARGLGVGMMEAGILGWGGSVANGMVRYRGDPLTGKI